ncbi:hypothetical protein CPB85DRAFT_828747 [Mucidula mucida]|nr:hypothetical protein CPB85DRAFT_828747 [Mucidula mucida]
MWGRLPAELIHDIVDLLAEDSDKHALYQLSLVNKAFLACARPSLFQDISINVCRNPRLDTHACGTPRCIKKLALLLKTRAPASIPRRIRTLTFNARDLNLVSCSSAWSIVSNPGAMDDESVTVPILRYFEEVEELRLIEVNLYALSVWASLRCRSTFLSSVRTVVLDEAQFYGGPPLLHSLISKMPNLERLCINGVDWPSRRGMPNNASKLYILLFNASVHFPLTFGPLEAVWYWSQGVFPHRFKPIPSSPSHLTLDLDEARGALSWIMLPALSEMLSKLLSLEIYYSCTMRQNNESSDDNPEFFLLKQLLASVPNVVHLTFRWRAKAYFQRSGILFQPDLSACISLRTLHLQVICDNNTWPRTWVSYRTWLHSTMHSIRDLPLKHVQVTMDLNVADMSFEGIDAPTSAADDSLCREDLTVEARVGMFNERYSWFRAPPHTHTADELVEKGWSCIRNIFPLCREQSSFVALVKAGRWL